MKRFFHPPALVRILALVLLSFASRPGAAAVALAAEPPNGPATNLYLPQVQAELPLLNQAVQSIEEKATAGTVFQAPVDATLDPAAKNIYFIANSARGMGVFKTSINGGTVVSLTVGAPFTQPLGVDISTDGQTIFVADSSVPAQSRFRRPQLAKGMLFRIPVGGGTPVAVAGTECTAPRGLTLTQENGVEMIYFTGIDPHDDQPAVMKIPAAGGTLTVIDKGAPLVLPTGIAVSKEGTIYISDQARATQGTDNVFRISQKHETDQSSSTATSPLDTASSHRELLATVRGGNPAGVALTQNGTLLLVSSHDDRLGASQVLVINTSTLHKGIVNTVIGTNDASGGLHRAYNSSEMVWVDLDGRIYVVKLKP
jgi:DNA-binding beta-propeller fold protein YncE